MAALRGRVNIPQASLTSGTTYNLLVGAAPTNQRVVIEGFGLYGTANAAGTPGLLQFCRATSAGTSSTAVTPKPVEEECTETFQSTWGTQPTGAPTGISAVDSREVNPQFGLSENWLGGMEMTMKGGGFWVLQFTPQVTGNYSGWVQIQE